MKNRNALIILAKAPEIEEVKTRLKDHLSDEQRLQLYVKLLTNTIRRMKHLQEIDTFICYTPPQAGGYFQQFGVETFPQVDGDLGARMFQAMAVIFRQGYKKAVLVGVDIPDLTQSIMKDAFELLENNDIVFGPANDGGYYLVGLKSPLQEIFRNIEWSTERTLRQSLNAAEEQKFSVALLKELSDIDTIEDLEKQGIRI